MAVSAGTATNFLDLYTKLRDFLRTDATLVAAGQQWTQVGGVTGTLTNTSEVILRGPGLSGADQVLVAFSPSVNIGTDTWNLGISGLVSYNAASDVNSQVNRSEFKYLSLWNSSMPYWFIANGRRFIVIVKISTTYQHAYGGFILPYCLPESWPYPLFIGGTNHLNLRYSDNGSRHGAYWDAADRSAAICLPDVTWYNVNNYDSGATRSPLRSGTYVDPPEAYMATRRENLDGTYTLEPCVVLNASPYAATLGVLQGVFRVSGFSQSSENTITIGGTTYRVFQDVFRSGVGNFCAIEYV